MSRKQDDTQLQKTKNLIDFTDNKFVKEFFDTIWPYQKLRLDIAELDRVNLPAAKIASFLFKAQLVEVELRGLIESFDRFLVLKTNKFYLYRKVSKNSVKVYQEHSFGQLKRRLDDYQVPNLEKLKTKLSFFHKKRNMFTHSLFLQNKDVEELAKEAEKYRQYAEESLILIDSIGKAIWEKGM